MRPDDPVGAGPFPSRADLGDEVWLALGGGGLKGMAHIGAWRALTEAGLRPAGIVGTSIGALIGALISAGMGWEELVEHGRALVRTDILRLNRRIAWINGVRQTSVFHGDTLRTYFERLLPPEGWEALRIPLQVNAVELGGGHTVWFGTGARTDVSLLDAVFASSALPVIYPPVRLGDGAYVDGGTEHPLGLERARGLGATGIIGIDVGVGPDGDTDETLARGIVGIHQRIFAIMSWRHRRDLLSHWGGPPILYVRPRLGEYDTFDFDSVEYFIDEGYRAMSEALETYSSL